ncbi:MAG: peptide chain release factor N(5)-glutamine methyltransferase [Bacteroidota bacterium]
MSIQDAYRQTEQQLRAHFGAGEARALTRNLFEDVFNWPTPPVNRSWSAAEAEQLRRFVARLLAGEPLQYLTGIADFYGLRFRVNPSVLIPRPETEELVAWVLEHEHLFSASPRLLDIGTGSGCIPLTLKKYWPTAEIWAVDTSEEALATANDNAKQLNYSIRTLRVDILQAEQRKTLPTFDLIVSNPPYIPPDEMAVMPAQVVAHEPHLALFVPAADPLLFYRTIMDFATLHLNERGLLFFECNEFNAEQVAAMGAEKGFTNGELRRDLQGKWRMWRGRKWKMS